MYYRFFIAESGPFYAAVAKAVDQRKHQIKSAQALAKNHGSKGPAFSTTGFGREQLIGLIYAEEDAPKFVKFWGTTKEGDRVYEPDKRFDAGKELSTEIGELNGTWPRVQEIGSRAIGAAEVLVCGDRTIASPGIGFINGVAVARIPMPDKHDEGDADWQPEQMDGLREVKQSEFLAAQGK